MKRCSKCKTERPLDQFAKNARNRDGLGVWCRSCRFEYGKKYAKTKGQRYYRLNKLKNRWGLSPESVDVLLEWQGGGCAICGAVRNDLDRDLCMDHDHDSGQRRGFLCNRCNRAIGLLGDDVVLLEKAIAYLEYYRASPYWERQSAGST